MARGPRLVDTLRDLADSRDDPRPDIELLQRFVATRDADAFAVLIRRHSPLVWGVCRRVLRHEHDAEDAFQATFLILARGASTVRRRSSLRCWLYGVALRVALRARDRAQRRREAPVTDVAISIDAPLTAAEAAELSAVLDEEVRRLPERYRLPLVLCYLLGHTNDEAAAELGCPRGTIAVRLARAREHLRRRLLHRGLGPTVALPVLPPISRPPCGLVPFTRTSVSLFTAGQPMTGPALNLANGVLTTMFLDRCKAVLLGLFAVGLLAAGGIESSALLARGPRGPGVDVAFAPVPEKAREDERLTAKLKPILESRQLAAKAWFDSQNEQFIAGHCTQDMLLVAGRALLKSEVEKCTTKAERIAVRLEHLGRMQKILGITRARFNAGRASVPDHSQCQFEVFDAEIELEREKAR